MADNYKDFDADVESSAESLEFTLLGDKYTLPGQIPARVVLTQMRFMDETGVVPTSVIPEWLESLLGKKVLDELIEKGATWNQLEELLKWVLQQYGIGNEMESESEEGDDSPK